MSKALTPPAVPEEPARLDIEHLYVNYGARTVLEDVSFRVAHGEQVAVVGPNGAGKSTLFKAMVGLLPAQRGQIYIHGLPLGHHKECVAYVPQREDVDWHFPVTVFDVVMMGRYHHLRGFQRPSAADRDAVKRALTQMGIADLANRGISELSGGQQQRVFIARALAQEPHILLMDEPFTGVDIATQEATLSLLDALREKHVTVMVSTHDLDLALKRFQSILVLNHSLVAYGPANEVFTPEALRLAFGGQVLFLNGAAAVVDQCCPGDEHDHIHTEVR
jgi:ABC-type Mn2+/Zn2+ transport system ATPase subunit